MTDCISSFADSGSLWVAVIVVDAGLFFAQAPLQSGNRGQSVVPAPRPSAASPRRGAATSGRRRRALQITTTAPFRDAFGFAAGRTSNCSTESAVDLTPAPRTHRTVRHRFVRAIVTSRRTLARHREMFVAASPASSVIAAAAVKIGVSPWLRAPMCLYFSKSVRSIHECGPRGAAYPCGAWPALRYRGKIHDEGNGTERLLARTALLRSSPQTITASPRFEVREQNFGGQRVVEQGDHLLATPSPCK